MPEGRELTRQPTRGTRALLLADEQHEVVPNYVTQFTNFSNCLQSLPVRLLLVLVQGSIWAYVAYAGANAAYSAGYVDSLACGARATLFATVTCVMVTVDFVVMISSIGATNAPSPWVSSKQGAAAMHQAIIENLVGVPVYVLLYWLPLCLWLRDGFRDFALAVVLAVIGLLIHNLVNACTFVFWGKHLELTQAKFAKRLVTGELSYDEAVSEYFSVNDERKASARFLSSSTISLGLLFFSMAVLLYDFEIRPWGGWYFCVLYITQALTIIIIFNPWLGLHDWPDALCAELMESTELNWTPSERSNLVTLVSTTKVKLHFFDFEMTHGFRTGICIFFFGWWLYMTELKQFHNFLGFPFDLVCFNQTIEEGGGSHEHHG